MSASPTSDLIRALDAAVDVLQRGHSAPAGRPEAFTDAAEFDGLVSLAAELNTLGPVPGPTAEFRRRLAREIQAAPEPRSLGRFRPVGVWQRAFRRFVLAGGVVAASVAFVAFGAVRASAGAVPGDGFYPVKRGVETVRLWAAGETALALHLELAGRRLEESVAAPIHGGILLAEFSREVTAALALADAQLAAGVPRAAVADPLVDWLLGARTSLVSHRAALPPTAWRAALALVDEAISALRQGRPLGDRPVPRLEDALRLLEQWSRSPQPWSGLQGGPLSWANDWFGSGRPPREAGSPVGAPVPQSPGQGTSPLMARDQRPPALPVVVGSEPGTAAPSQPELPVSPAPTDARPTLVPRPGPTSTEVPREPTQTQVLPDPTSMATGTPDPGAGTAPASPTPSPTTVPVNQPPVIRGAWCYPDPVWVFETAACWVDVEDLDNSADELTYYWRADAGRMLNHTRRDATYYASFSHGVKETITWIRVTVTDPEGASSEEAFQIRVVAADNQTQSGIIR